MRNLQFCFGCLVAAGNRNQRRSTLRHASLAIGALLFSQIANAALITSGTYDENSVQTNTVDQIATPTDTATRVSLATLKSAVTAAYAADSGGVINFDSGSLNVGGTSLTASYGISGTKSITVTNGSATGPVWRIDTHSTGDHASISGSQVLGGYAVTTPAFTSGQSEYVFDFNAADKVIMVGGTLLQRASGSSRNYNASVTYSDATTDTVSFTSSNSATNDWFAGFKSSTDGVYITKFSFVRASGTNNQRKFDDLAFVTVPEPASLGIVLIGGAALLLRGRRA